MTSDNNKNYSNNKLIIFGNSTPAGQPILLNGATNVTFKGTEMSNGMFMTRHTCDMRFTYASEK